MIILMDAGNGLTKLTIICLAMNGILRDSEAEGLLAGSLSRILKSNTFTIETLLFVTTSSSTIVCSQTNDDVKYGHSFKINNLQYNFW